MIFVKVSQNFIVSPEKFPCITKTRLCNILQYFTAVKMIIENCDIFHIFAQNIDCGYMSTHNLCFRAKIRK